MMKREFTESEMKAFEPTEKIGVIGTVTPEGLPHLTLITALQAKTPDKMIWGQFSYGLSKLHVKDNQHVGFLIMTMDRKMWRGKAEYTHAAREGEDYVMFNEKPMFRYNTYFGINTVHYMDLVETTEQEGLPLARIVPALLLTKLVKSGAATGNSQRILTTWGEDLFNKLDSLKFMSYIGDDGYPVIVPLLQCQAADSRRLVFSTIAYSSELKNIPTGTPMAIFGLTLAMEDILVRGTFRGYSRRALVQTGTIDLDYVYNSMPPGHGQIYPPVPLEPVVNF